MLKLPNPYIFLFLFFYCSNVFSENCNQLYWKGISPKIVDPRKAVNSVGLCFDSYALLYSSVSRTSMWAAEHLTRDQLGNAKKIKRVNSFHAEPALQEGDRSELVDYAHSGYDRGHLAPSGDMPTRNAQHQSFSLANMVPQNSNNNQHLWEGIESTTRELALKHGSIYVVTGPIFEGATLVQLNGRVLVPTGLFKAIYDEQTKEAGAYIVKNAPGNDYEIVSIDTLDRRIGIDVFPALQEKVRRRKTALEVPHPHGKGDR